jgi:hypothetical protein
MKATTEEKMVMVTERALVARINRKLVDDGLKVAELRGRAAEDYGKYVLIPIPSAADVLGHGPAGPLSRIERTVDPEELARELGVVAAGDGPAAMRGEIFVRACRAYERRVRGRPRSTSSRRTARWSATTTCS